MTQVTTLEKKVSWAQEVLSRKDAKLQEVKFPFSDLNKYLTNIVLWKYN